MDPESMFFDAVLSYPDGLSDNVLAGLADNENIQPWKEALDKLSMVFSGQLAEDSWWDGLPPLSQENRDTAQRVRYRMSQALSLSKQSTSSPRGLATLQGQTPFQPSQDIIRADNDIRDSQLLNTADLPVKERDAHQASPNSSPILIRSKSDVRRRQSQYSDDDSSDDEDLNTAATLASLASPRSRVVSAQTLCSPAGALKVSGSLTWPLKEELRGTEAHHYRGPLSWEKVLSLLSPSSDISENGSRALTGTHVGYLQYYHFLGTGTVPTSRRRAKDKETSSSQLREIWQCRLCHKNCHVPPAKISNLGAHLYGKTNKVGKVTQVGCLDTRRFDSIEKITDPDRDEEGELIHHRAASKASASSLNRSAAKRTRTTKAPETAT